MYKRLGILPFVLSAVFYISRFFTLFALLPLLLLRTQKSKKTVLFAFLSNVLIVGVVSGLLQCQIECSQTSIVNAIIGNISIFFLMIGLPLYFLPKYYFDQNKSIDRSILMTVLWVVLMGLFFFLLASYLSHQRPIDYFNNEVSLLVNQVMELAKTQDQAMVGLTAESVKERILNEVPSYFIIFLTLSLWANVMFLMRLTPFYFIHKKGDSLMFIKTWKAPEWLVWPTILLGAAMLYDFGWPSVVASNLLRVVLMVYGFQGLSVMSCVFDRFKIGGLLRTLLYILLAWPLLPLLLAVGFFDLWFDFRAKLRQS